MIADLRGVRRIMATKLDGHYRPLKIILTKIVYIDFFICLWVGGNSALFLDHIAPCGGAHCLHMSIYVGLSNLKGKRNNSSGYCTENLHYFSWIKEILILLFS